MTDGNSNDLDHFSPNSPDRKIEDKAAQLEHEIVSIRASFNKERVTYHFVIALFLNVLIFSLSPDQSVKYLTLAGSIILLYATARWLDHPWLGDTLGKWNDLLFEAAKRKLLGNRKDDVEPTP